jgi:hypothetical protein
LQSLASLSLLTVSRPERTRPVNWLWVSRMPVSMMYAVTPVPAESA